MNKEELVQYFIDHPALIKNSKAKWVADHYKLDFNLVKESYLEAKDKTGFVTTKPKGDSRLLETLEKHNLPLDQVKRLVVYGNAESPMYSITPREEWLAGEKEDFILKLSESIKEYKIPNFTPSNINKGDSIAVLNLYDAHIDLINLSDETNPKGDVDQNLEIFEDAFDKLLSQTLIYSPETIIFPVGNDFFNANDNRNTTLKGTPQDSSPFWKQSFIKGYECLRRCIDKANKYCNVHVYMIKGNHDEDKDFYLGQLLKITYEGTSNVLVEDTTKDRKYFKYSNTLLSFSHGDKLKKYVATLPATIMIENKQIMPEIDFIHHFSGDIHHGEKFQLKSSEDLKGCTISFLRSMCDLSKWCYEQGYVGIPKTAESYIFKKGKGLTANLQVHI